MLNLFPNFFFICSILAFPSTASGHRLISAGFLFSKFGCSGGSQHALIFSFTCFAKQFIIHLHWRHRLTWSAGEVRVYTFKALDLFSLVGTRSLTIWSLPCPVSRPIPGTQRRCVMAKISVTRWNYFLPYTRADQSVPSRNRHYNLG